MREGIVWVLGAGFSAGLGAPMLGQLLTDHSIVEVQARYRDKPGVCSDTAQRIVRVYLKGVERHLWDDPEVFMDYVETAGAGDNFRAEVLKGLDPNLSGPPAAWSSALKRFVAARVSTFLYGANLESELWAPYLRWARALSSDDTIITFNWDRTLELLAHHGEKPATLAADDKAGRPHTALKPDSFNTAAGLVCTKVYKLHGSVDWCRLDGSYRINDDPLFALDCADSAIAIATPGPSKLDASSTFLSVLWERASKALSQARAVVFLGYRFPPSDSQARETLLSALSVAPSPPGSLRAIHTILGPNVNGEQSARLAALVRGMLDGVGWTDAGRMTGESRYLVQQHPLYGQDFMSVFTRDRLIDPTAVTAPKAFSWPSSA